MIFRGEREKAQAMDDSITTASSSDTTTLTEIPVTQREVNQPLTDSQLTEASSDILKDSDSSKETKSSNDDDLDSPKIAAPAPTTTPGASDGTSHASCVKDENGFTYYKCRFCGLTFNYLTTLKAHERVHDIETVGFGTFRNRINFSFFHFATAPLNTSKFSAICL